MKLIIVESPSKCKYIQEYVGSDFNVVATKGHIREIPSKGMNIDIEGGFIPAYSISPTRKEEVKRIKTLASKAEKVYLATDKDREGEAIAWHVFEILPKKDQKKCVRSTFDEIQKKAVNNGIKNPRELDYDQIDAAKARQVLDRLIGYKASPLVGRRFSDWHLSAGRCQSVFLKAVCSRQKEIDAFKPQDFWYIDALLKADDGDFWSRVVTKDKDNRYIQEKVAKDDFDKIKAASFKVAKIEQKPKKVAPNPPFDTASLQSTCSALFKWSIKRSQSIAQSLYESGKITYIRTDCFNISGEAITEVRGLIKKAASDDYLPKTANKFSKKSKASAQEAHECIRPTNCYDKGDDLSKDEQRKMYKLIRDRFIACQMAPMQIDTVAYHIDASSGHKLISRGQTIKFDGWFKVYKYSKTKEEVLPSVTKGDTLDFADSKCTKNTTKPPPRYTEGTLVKKMEKEGVGRPSTMASLVEKIKNKKYVIEEKGKIIATVLGMSVCDFLDDPFKDFFMDAGYSADLEESIDSIAHGKKGYLNVVKETYGFMMEHEIFKRKKLSDGQDTSSQQIGEDSGEKCTVCKDGKILIKPGKWGMWYACDKYPDCKSVYTKNDDDTFTLKGVANETGSKCAKCGEEIVEKNGRFGLWYPCSKYPTCKSVYMKDDDGNFSLKKKAKATGSKCTKCSSDIVEKKGKYGVFYACSGYPKCRTTYIKDDDGNFKVKPKKAF